MIHFTDRRDVSKGSGMEPARALLICLSRTADRHTGSHVHVAQQTTKTIYVPNTCGLSPFTVYSGPTPNHRASVPSECR